MKKKQFFGLLALAFATHAHAQDVNVSIPKQQVNEKIRAMVPAKLLEQGFVTSVSTGAYPPFTIVKNSSQIDGAGADIAAAIGQILGLEIRFQVVAGLPAALAGVGSKRYDLSFGPNADLPKRQEKTDFIDWVKAYVSFLVPKGNPKGIKSIDDVCGLHIAVEGGGSAEAVLRKRSETCLTENKPAVSIQSYGDQPAAVLAVRSGRSDAFFSSQAVLVYFAQQANQELEIAAANLPNGFGDIYQGAFVPKDSSLGDALLAGFQEISKNGTYEAILRKWGVESMMLKATGKNLAK